ncbi:MAG: SMEK domain-containing protein [Chryseobacterium sp.]|uniref:SMEK domain-containing protein n=1 Tax=Chryseobacterium sp. TaxID=1871047 RepID=UPI0025C42673|nr:SMEK domain-containing protein [Chryseobacterium sp.]MCJ7932491.1 SMEK domain-containing protein [Chryseobacterium sp.]
MSLPDYFHNIRTYLFAYADHLKYTNSVGLGDYNIFAENLFKDLLNVLFDWDLLNANAQRRNQKSYDLVSKANNIFIQVTANKNHKKNIIVV